MSADGHSLWRAGLLAGGLFAGEFACLYIGLQHTSASLILCENADPDVRKDLEMLLSRLAPDGDPAYVHDTDLSEFFTLAKPGLNFAFADGVEVTSVMKPLSVEPRPAARPHRTTSISCTSRSPWRRVAPAIRFSAATSLRANRGSARWAT